MLSSDYAMRFGAVGRLYGETPQQVIGGLHIGVIGVGGVGSWAVEALARTGVGRITLIDHDEVCASNVNRQLHATSETIGRQKVAVMAERVAQINPDCRCDAIDDFLTMATLEQYLQRDYDYVIDALDSIKFKAALIHYCRRHKIPVVATGAAGGLSDPSLIKVADLSRTYNDPLAAKVRSRLRGEYGFSTNPKRRFGVECVFSSQQQVYPKADGSVGHEKPGIHGISLDCRFGYGSATFVTATFGFMAVSRAINKSLAKHARRAKEHHNG